ncbi:MAG: DUF6478 family protein [Brevirhabdus sp.]
MLKRVKDLITLQKHKRILRAWQDVSDQADEMDLHQLRTVRGYARQQKRRIDQFVHEADARLTLPLIGSNAIRKPMYCDFAYRPEIWRGPINPPGMAAVQSQSMLGQEATLFHDCRFSELTLRQIRNTRESDLAPFGLRLDVFNFDGSFLSLVLELPNGAVDGLRLNHVIRLDTIVEMEKPLEIFARLNIKHGPNTEQIVRELPLNENEVQVEFDMAYTKIHEKRVERMWLDLIFEGPQMNQVVVRDLTLTRRPRSEL